MIHFLRLTTKYTTGRTIIMIKQGKSKGYKWLSLLLVFTMLITYIPFSNVSPVMAETNEQEQIVNDSGNQIDKNESKEIKNKRTENSRTYLNSDGTYSTEISQKPMNFKNNHNEWQLIENELEANNSENVYENKANAFKVKFDKKHTPDSSLIQLEDEQGTVEFALEPLEHTNTDPIASEGIVEGESITYSNVYPDIDIKYTVGVDRIKEDIIYNQKPSEGFPEKFTYKMDLNGMIVKENNGTIYLYDADNDEPLYFFEAPYMFDSFTPEGFKSNKEIFSIPEEAMSYEIDLDYEIVDGQLYLYVIPNQEWLTDGNRVYPLTIDPTIVKINSNTMVQDTNIRSAFPIQTGGNDQELGVGLYKDTKQTNVIRSLLKFDVSAVPKNAIVTNADLNLWMSSVSNETLIDVEAYQITQSWNEALASWNNRSSSLWSVKGGDYAKSPLDTVGLGHLVDLSTNLKWKIPVDVIHAWVDYPNTNYGILMKSKSETTNSYKKFISSENSIGSNYQPLLVVTYKIGARLGLENYWDYDTQPLVGGNVFTNNNTGNNVIQYQDFSLIARGGFDFGFTRTYNSKSLEKSAFGLGWIANGFENLYINSQNNIDYTDEDGTVHTFTYDDTTKLYKAGPGNYDAIRSYSVSTNNQTQHFFEMSNQSGEKTVFKINKIDPSTNTQIARLEYKEDRHGNRIQFEYDNDRLVKISSPLDTNLVKSISFTYNAAGLIDSAKYEGNELKFQYIDGKLTQVDQLKNDGKYVSTKFEYKGNILSAVIDPNERRTDFGYQNEMITKVQSPDIHQDIDGVNRPGSEYSLDTVNKIATVIDPEGNETTYYMNNDFVTERMIAGGLETHYELDPNYNIKKENIAGSITSNTYDTKGNLLTSIDPEGKIQTYTYTNFGNVETHTDSDSKITTFIYNQTGDLHQIVIPDESAISGKQITVYEHDVFGDLKLVTLPDGSKQLFDINYLNSIKTITSIDAFGNQQIEKTELQGNLLEKWDGENNLNSFEYNVKNELEKVIDPKLRVTTYGYDSNGNLSSILNARGHESIFNYNDKNLLVEEINALEHITSYDYDLNGNLEYIHLPTKHSIRNVYDGLNRLNEFTPMVL